MSQKQEEEHPKPKKPAFGRAGLISFSSDNKPETAIPVCLFCSDSGALPDGSMCSCIKQQEPSD